MFYYVIALLVASLFDVLTVSLKADSDKDLEIMVLRHQVRAHPSTKSRQNATPLARGKAHPGFTGQQVQDRRERRSEPTE